jgi:uncharacterized lipoprotein YddW (UPF0748 family)
LTKSASWSIEEPVRSTRFSPRFYLPAILLCGLLFSAFIASAQEFRGAWIASVWNINFPSKQGLSADAQRREIVALLDAARSAQLNHIFVQVRPEACAMYPSKLEPWSRFLTGKQGVSPGFDPLQTFIDEGRRRGIRVHAWLNPYRAGINASQPRHASHVTNRYPQHTKRVGNLLWLDPGAPAIRRHLLSVVQDLIRRYDLAGIHLDDYFYPYPAPGKTINFPDSDTYEAYKKSGGKLSLPDWRRDNVNTLVREMQSLIKREKPRMLFGVSPFGIYTRGQPPEVQAGLDQFNQIYADPVKWMREGWVDYLVPQLYWKEGGPQSFSALLRWWRSPAVNPRGIPVYPGIALDRLGGTHNWPLSEIQTQLNLERRIGPRPGGGGFVLYNIGQVASNTKGVRNLLSR